MHLSRLNRLTGWIPLLLLGCGVAAAASTTITRIRPPAGGIQPQAVIDPKGALHLVYFRGEPRAGDLFYVRREAGKERWSEPLRVNSQPGSAVAAGTIRGAQIALGKGGRIHVAWNGSRGALPQGPSRPERSGQGHHGGHGASPMLYTRLNDAGTAFEPQRNLMQSTFLLDGGGSIAADRAGNVYVAWHAVDASGEGEQARRIWVARSQDEGKSFSAEVPAFSEPTGACACCGIRAFADSRGTLYIMYRSASTTTDRDMYLLVSRDRGKSFRGTLIHPWKVPG